MNDAATRHGPAPVLPDAAVNVVRPDAPVLGRITRSEICTSRRAAGFCRHIEIDVTGTRLEAACLPGQSIGILPPGADPKGRPYAVRLYSLASPRRGEDGSGRILSTTVKRTIAEHWQDHRLFLGVCSNYLCDLQIGDEVRLTGPAGKRFLLPTNTHDHDYLFFATGTGIAPFRGFLLDLFPDPPDAPSPAPSAPHPGPLTPPPGPHNATLIMGSPYSTDLIYHDLFTTLAQHHPSFSYLTALSREPQPDAHPPMYVQHRLSTHADQLRAMLESERTLIYVCGLAGMELGILQQLAALLPERHLCQYVEIDPAIRDQPETWERKMIHRQLKLTKRVLLEVYA